MSADAHEPTSNFPTTTRSRPTTRMIVVAATVALAIAGAAFVFTRGGKEQTTTNGIAATLHADGQPNGLAAGPDGLWVALNQAAPSLKGRLDRVNLTSGAVEKSVPIGGVLTHTQRNGDSVWVESSGDWGDSSTGTLVQVGWTSGKVIGQMSFDKPPFGFDFGAGSLWLVVGRNPATLVQFDPVTHEQQGTPITLSPQRVIGLAFGDGKIWAAAAEDGELIRVDPETRRVDTVKVGDFPVGVEVANGSVWVANRGSGTVSRVDPDKLVVVDTIDVGNLPTWLRAAGGSIWVANQADGTVSRIDATTGDLVGPPVEIAAPSDSDAAAHLVATNGDSVWVSSITEKTVSRIDAGS